MSLFITKEVPLASVRWPLTLNSFLVFTVLQKNIMGYFITSTERWCEHMLDIITNILGLDIIGTPPLPPFIKGGRVGPSENCVTRGGGGTKLFARGGGGGWCKNGGLSLFYYFTVQSHLLCGEDSKVPFITFQIFIILS